MKVAGLRIDYGRLRFEAVQPKIVASAARCRPVRFHGVGPKQNGESALNSSAVANQQVVLVFPRSLGTKAAISNTSVNDTWGGEPFTLLVDMKVLSGMEQEHACLSRSAILDLRSILRTENSLPQVSTDFGLQLAQGIEYCLIRSTIGRVSYFMTSGGPALISRADMMQFTVVLYFPRGKYGGQI